MPASRRSTVIFGLLCVVCVVVTVGYAWRATVQRNAGFERRVLPSIESLSELERPPDDDAAEGPTGPSGPPAAEVATAGSTPVEPETAPARDEAAPAPEDRHALDATETADVGDERPADPGEAIPDPMVLLRHTGLDDSFGAASVQSVGTGDTRRVATPLRCDRLHFARDRGVCLTRDRFYTTHSIMVFDRDFTPLHRLPLNGVPSRVRVAPNGRLAAVTVFVSGHSYADEGFSTETSIIDTDTGERIVANLEEFAFWRDGAQTRAVDMNIWGITFTGDSDRFYATLGTDGALLLIEGRVSSRRATVVMKDVECPSLSPDGSRLAFKRRVGGGPGFAWRLHVIELDTGTVTPLAETRHVDDQVEWLDDATVLYQVPDPDAPTPMVTDVWKVPADGSGAPERVLIGAASPAVLRSSLAGDDQTAG